MTEKSPIQQIIAEAGARTDVVPLQLPGLSLPMFSREMTLHDQDVINRKAKQRSRTDNSKSENQAVQVDAAPSYQEVIIATIVHMVADEDGKQMFNWSDRGRLMNEVKSSTLMDIYTAIVTDTKPNGDVGKKSDTREAESE
jgi:hypothetical protein